MVRVDHGHKVLYVAWASWHGTFTTVVAMESSRLQECKTRLQECEDRERPKGVLLMVNIGFASCDLPAGCPTDPGGSHTPEAVWSALEKG